LIGLRGNALEPEGFLHDFHCRDSEINAGGISTGFTREQGGHKIFCTWCPQIAKITTVRRIIAWSVERGAVSLPA